MNGSAQLNIADTLPLNMNHTLWTNTSIFVHTLSTAISLLNSPPYWIIFFEHHHLFPCCFCNDPQKIYLNEHYLHNHAHQHCPSTRPDNRLNSSLISDAFQSIPSLQNTWSMALPWLDHLEISPPPFHESHYSRITHYIHQTTHDYYGILLRLVIDSTPSLDPNYLHSHINLPAYEYSSSPFWNFSSFWSTYLSTWMFSLQTFQEHLTSS